MSAANPFSVAFLTEANLAAKDLLDRYCFSPLHYVGDDLHRPMNVFLVGRRGIGKTMLLKLYDPSISSLLYRDPPRHSDWVVKSLPKATVGVYFTLSGPDARLEILRNAADDPEFALAAYGDYLNNHILRAALHNVATMAKVEQWRSAAGLGTAAPLERKSVATHLMTSLRKESSQYDGVSTIAELVVHLEERLQRWTRFANGHIGREDTPKEPLPFGRPLFALVDTLRRSNLFQEPFRLWILVDQYEHLHQISRIIDFRPVFNAALSLATRGGTGVEFKVGTRQYAYRTSALQSVAGRIESNREIVEIDLDKRARRFFPKLAEEIVVNRLGSLPGLGRPRRASAILPKLRPFDEASIYVGDATDRSRHVRPFTERWVRYGISQEVAADAIRESSVMSSHPLVATLACVAVTRWLRDGASKVPQWMQGSETPSLTTALYHAVRAIDQRYRLGVKAREHSANLRFVDDFVRDVESAALCQLAAAYKNQRKIYSGFDTITRVCSNVAVVLIEIMYEAFELASSSPGTKGKILPKDQSEAIYAVSERWFENLPKDYDYGAVFQQVIGQLGAALREIQLEPTLPQPTPNGVSIRSVEIDGAPGAAVNDPRSSARGWLESAVGWGLLEAIEHQSKSALEPKRRKLYLNRILCPYFGLLEVSKKDPVYVESWDRFFDALRKNQRPQELTALLDRAKGPAAPTAGPLFHQDSQ